MGFPTRTALGLAMLLLLAGCLEAGPGLSPDAAETIAADAVAKPAGVDWSRCRFPDLALPVPGRLFVVDGGQPGDDAEPGRETIRRVDILVPGPVALLLTAPDASVWLLRPSPETEVVAVFASGAQPQRITGQALGPARLTRSLALGDDCGRYWLDGGAGPALAEAAGRVFGRPYDALYTLRVGQVTIGGTESLPQSVPEPPLR